jgi:tetratricopeptide (TPR) repeat protein
MARGAAQARRKAAKKTRAPQRQRAPRRPKTVEQTMFFPRLRAQAKWVFVFLAAVFALGFVFFGVGSGSTGLGDILRGNFNIFGSSGTTTSSGVKNALKRTKANPNDAKAWNDLVTAYQTDGKDTKANDARLHYLKLRPKDPDALQAAAAYYENRANTKYSEAQSLRTQAPLDFGTVVGTSPSTAVGQILAQDPISQSLAQKAQTDLSDFQSSLRKDEQYLRRYVKVQPDDVNTQFRLGQIAEYLGHRPVALAAYKQVVKLAPTDPTARVAKQRIAVLAPAAGGKK